MTNLTDETERLCLWITTDILSSSSIETHPERILRRAIKHMRALQARVAELENSKGHAGNHLFPDTSCHICGPNYIGRCPHGATHG